MIPRCKNVMKVSYKALYPAVILSFKVNKGNARITCEMCLRLTIKIPWSHSGVYIVNLEHKRKRCQLTPDLNLFRSKVRGIPEPSSAMRDILVTSRRVVRKIIQSIRIKSGLSARIRKRNQFSQFRWTSTKLIPIEKT